MTWEFGITVAAIVIGPVTAVLVAQWLQNKERMRERQLHVFRGLMSTRRAQLSQERVSALNLVEMEFAGNSRILDQFRELMILYGDKARWTNEDVEVRRELIQNIDDKSVLLINEIGKVLGYKYEHLDILRGGYYPEAFVVAEEQQRTIREFLVGLREGKLLVPVAVLDYRSSESRGVPEAAEKRSDP